MTTKGEHVAGRHALSGVMAGRRDVLWGVLWAGGLLLAWSWLGLYLNAPARALVGAACLHTFSGAVAAVAAALVMGWGAGLLLHFLESSRRRSAYLALSFVLNLLRSVPQIVGMLIGYVIVTGLTLNEALTSDTSRILATSLVTALFVFQEVVDLIRERIRHFESLEFVSALLVCGVPSRVIINREILLKNSMAYIVQKSVALFGRAIFLICSIDFIVSVGLSSEVSLSNLPVTLGSMLAKLDSKQDILAIGSALTDARVIPTLFVEHLQGISVAFLIVYTLLCVYRIANGLMERYRL
jgi:ABC-type dipeptide/oligopeptide/nickel transport system permease subunit